MIPLKASGEYIYIYMTCHAKTRPSAQKLILRKTRLNCKIDCVFEVLFFIFEESIIFKLSYDTFKSFRRASIAEIRPLKDTKVSFRHWRDTEINDDVV